MEEPQTSSASDFDRLQETAEMLRALRGQADQTLESHRQRLSSIESQLTVQLQQVAEELARDHVADELEVDANKAQQEELRQSQASLAEVQAELEQVRSEFAGQLAEKDAQLVTTSEELDRLRQEQQQLSEEKQHRDDEFAQLQEQHDQLAQQRQQLADELAATRSEAEGLQAAPEQLAEINGKFELALADVQKLKRENAELQEELANRSEGKSDESAELVSLRAERDSLADRVEQLENEPHTIGDADKEQELADLQRRFELAVDDVRELKQKNAELQSKLDAGSDAASIPSAGPLDWQAQKAQLLASLELEGEESCDAERLEQRATIEGTITITDQVVAKKDQEIANLKSQLESGASASSEDAAKIEADARAAALDEIFDKDELIQAERERLEQARQEWHDKVREAELEISVQRATLARERLALEEKLAAIQAIEETSKQPADEKPRHRWLSALGLKDDSDE